MRIDTESNTLPRVDDLERVVYRDMEIMLAHARKGHWDSVDELMQSLRPKVDALEAIWRLAP